MFKVPYELVAIEADKIIVKMALATTRDDSYYYSERYNLFITACGWTNFELDQETLNRADINWERLLLKKNILH